MFGMQQSESAVVVKPERVRSMFEENVESEGVYHELQEGAASSF